MGFTHADTAIAQATTSVSTQSITLSAAVAAGDVVCLEWASPNPGADTISDTAGNTWVIPGAALNFQRFAYSIITVPAAGGITITSTGGGSGTRFMVADRFSVSGGRAAFGSAVSQAVSGTSGNVGSISNVPGGELLYGTVTTGNASATFTAGSSNSVSATIGSQIATASGGGFSQYIVSGAGGTESITWTSSVSLTGRASWEAFFALAVVTQPRATVPVPRRRPSRAVWQGRAMPGGRSLAPAQQFRTAPRRPLARAYVRFTPVVTVNAVPVSVPSGTVQPRATVPVPRRPPSRGVWRGSAVPGVVGLAPAQQFRTAPRRVPARAYVRFTPVVTVNAQPAGGRPVPVLDVESRLIRRYRHMLHRHGMDWEPEVSMLAAPVAVEVPPGWPGTWPVQLTEPEPEPELVQSPSVVAPKWRPVYMRPPKARLPKAGAMMPVWRKDGSRGDR